MIVIKNLCKTYYSRIPFNTLKSFLLNFKKNKDRMKLVANDLIVIKNLTVTLEEGKILGVIGPNGAGKSTLAKLIAGTIEPTSGCIKSHGRIVPFLELGVAFSNELTGEDNFYLNGVLLGLSLDYLNKNKENIFEFAGVKDFMQIPLKYYSSGMQLRLAFSIAMHAKGDIYIFDEILAVGDADFQKKCMDAFQGLLKNKKTIIIVSHDLDFLLKYVDHLLYLDKSGHALIKKDEITSNVYDMETLKNYAQSKFNMDN